MGYDPDEQLLQVELQDGKVYEYVDVPEEIYTGLMEADSHGRYFNNHVRGLSYRRLR